MKIIDAWEQDHFEDYVASSLIAMYESKIIKVRHQHPLMCANKKDLDYFRSIGPYIPGCDRIIEAPGEDGFVYDERNDPLIDKCCIGLMIKKKTGEDQIDGYFDMVSIKRVNHLPKCWSSRNKGKLYMKLTCVFQNKGIFLRKTFFNLENSKITLCDFIIQDNNSSYGKHQKIVWREEEPKLINEHEFAASIAMQYSADSRFCWSIKAEEKEAKVRIGCQKEEIKSLLYARTLPLTKTGRKRPVLHLVEAHKRRLKNGVDIDIDSFLRGTQKVEISGTLFTVIPPQTLKKDVSKRSYKFFDENIHQC